MATQRRNTFLYLLVLLNTLSCLVCIFITRQVVLEDNYSIVEDIKTSFMSSSSISNDADADADDDDDDNASVFGLGDGTGTDTNTDTNTNTNTDMDEIDDLPDMSGINGGGIKEEDYSSFLPKKVYSVIGLESSGTKFVSKLITTALNQTNYREGSFSYPNPEDNLRDVQVQHFSLPWGSSCGIYDKSTPILDVVLPAQCSESEKAHFLLPRMKDIRFSDEAKMNYTIKYKQEVSRFPQYQQCGQIAHELYGLPLSIKRIKHPERYLLDIVSHKEWYEAHGVDQYFIIVLRDYSISRKARKISLHCTDPDKLEEEEDIGKKIIIDAINKYILENDPNDDNSKVVTKENFDFWTYNNLHTFTVNPPSKNDKFNNTARRSRRLASSTESIIPNKNNVIVVSYESMMLLKEPYIKIMFDALGLELPDELPHIKDGNMKYTAPKKKKKEESSSWSKFFRRFQMNKS